MIRVCGRCSRWHVFNPKSCFYCGFPGFYKWLTVYGPITLFLESKLYSLKIITKRLLARLGVKICHADLCFNYGYFRRQNTAYVDDHLNFNILCEDCQAEADEYWGEMWREYNHSRF